MSGMTVSLLPRQAYCANFTPNMPVVGFAYEVQAGEHAFGSDRRAAFRAIPNSLAFTPPGCDVYSKSETGGEYLVISVSNEQFDAIAADIDDCIAPLRVSDRVLPPAIGPACVLRRMLLCADDFDFVTFEAECVAVVEMALCAASGGSEVLAPARSITTRRLHTLEELVQARLGGRLSVGAMAAAVGLSTGFFIRAFRARVGQPPHTYLMNRRLSHARALLETTNRSVADIAFESGFSSQAHMTTAFRRTLGITPKAYRAAR
jgi:AraC family transcriptional regulator